MNEYESEHDYLSRLSDRAILPRGFQVGVHSVEFFPAERALSQPLKMNLGLITLDKETDSFAAVFTQNLFPGAPVKIGRKRLAERKKIFGVLVNNKISNVCAPQGEEDAEEILCALGKELGVDSSSLVPASTGIIGWRLPKNAMVEGLSSLVKSRDRSTLTDLAKAIMTTDLFPKVRSVAVGDGFITAVAKGAGMIEPNMATMLCFVMTDLDIEADDLQRALKIAVEESFNSISVDSDQSTSDTVLALSSRLKEAVPFESFLNGLKGVCSRLAEDIVRNGEGVHHVIKVKVTGAQNHGVAKQIGKAIVNSPLVKTAIFGNDPNVGRLVSSIGDECGNKSLPINPQEVRVSLGQRQVFAQGAFTLDEESERFLSQYLISRKINPTEKRFPEHENCVEIEVELGTGEGSATVTGADLSYDYVKENADYRS